METRPSKGEEKKKRERGARCESACERREMKHDKLKKARVRKKERKKERGEETIEERERKEKDGNREEKDDQYAS